MSGSSRASTTADDARSGPSGLRTWFAVGGGIGAWLVHLIAVASLARISCTGSGTGTWVVHGLTVALALVTVGAMVLAEGLRRAAPDGDDPPAATAVVTAEGFATLEFLGRFGLLVGAVNLLLIVFEGSMAVWLSPCR